MKGKMSFVLNPALLPELPRCRADSVLSPLPRLQGCSLALPACLYGRLWVTALLMSQTKDQ